MSRQNNKIGVFGVYIELEEQHSPAPEKPVFLAVSRTSRYYPTVELMQRFVVNRPNKEKRKLAPMPFVTPDGRPLVKVFIPDGSMQAHNSMPKGDSVTIFNPLSSSPIEEYYDAVFRELQSGLEDSNKWGDQLSAQLIENIKKAPAICALQLEESATDALACSMIIRWSDIERQYSSKVQEMLMKYLKSYREQGEFFGAVNSTTDTFLAVPGRDTSLISKEYSHRYLIFEAAAIELFSTLGLTNSLAYQSEKTPLIDFVVKQLRCESSFYFSSPEPLLLPEQLADLEKIDDPVYRIAVTKLRETRFYYEQKELTCSDMDRSYFRLAEIDKTTFQQILAVVIKLKESSLSPDSDSSTISSDSAISCPADSASPPVVSRKHVFIKKPVNLARQDSQKSEPLILKRLEQDVQELKQMMKTMMQMGMSPPKNINPGESSRSDVGCMKSCGLFSGSPSVLPESVASSDPAQVGQLLSNVASF